MPSKARFRTFLRVCLDRFVQNQAKAAGREKRGGGRHTLSLDFVTAEGELRQHEPPDPADVEQFFRQEVIRTLFARAVADIREDYERRGKAPSFACSSATISRRKKG